MRVPKFRRRQQRKHERRIAQADLPDVAESWQALCLVSGGDIFTNEPCVNLAGINGINALLATGGVCDQQDNADAMIDFAKSANVTNGPALIANAIAYRQHPRSAVEVNGVTPSTLYCQKAPKNPELNGIVNAQLPGVDPGLFGDPNNAIVAFGDAATCPFGQIPDVTTCSCSDDPDVDTSSTASNSTSTASSNSTSTASPDSSSTDSSDTSSNSTSTASPDASSTDSSNSTSSSSTDSSSDSSDTSSDSSDTSTDSSDASTDSSDTSTDSSDTSTAAPSAVSSAVSSAAVSSAPAATDSAAASAPSAATSSS
ncbi:hypothetical protein BV25DRAFT_1800343 [Artomyces pyxidatus]|uniref:Uncharacterized protein n=1 Tax=Artomyces pyxidatus TaxID=48021 RepID=A0ACB8T6U5_9AGAM|nr:hypothetical protein BV25DRAFT_1800343 [Artomyces pyxidatus]